MVAATYVIHFASALNDSLTDEALILNISDLVKQAATHHEVRSDTSFPLACSFGWTAWIHLSELNLTSLCNTCADSNWQGTGLLMKYKLMAGEGNGEMHATHKNKLKLAKIENWQNVH